jgi:hypothetical protein
VRPLLLLAALAACGGGSGGPRGGTVGNRVAASSPLELVLYRDGALVRERKVVEVGAGGAIAAVPLPPDVEVSSVLARMIDPGGGAARLGSLSLIEPTLVPGDQVEVTDGKRTLRGTLRWMGARELVLEVDGAIRVVLDPDHVIRQDDRGASRRLEVQVVAEKAGKATVEIVYVTRSVRWVADYTLIMDPASQRAELHGALGIDNAGGITWEEAAITLVDTDRPVKVTAFDHPKPEPVTEPRVGGKPAPVADPTKPRAEQPVKLAKPAEQPRTTLPFTVDVRPGAQSVSLLAGSHVLPAKQTLVFDPLGDDRDLTAREPNKDKNYGLDKKSTAVSQSIDVDLDAAKIPAGLPAGTVRLVERSSRGELTPLGESRIFESKGSDPEKITPTTSVAVGRANHVEGKRTRREFTLDDEDKRLTEEFEVELTNDADHPVEVIVREHLYRGQNWTLAYFSEPKVEKEGSQKIALHAKVPAKGTARVVYRVVYWW